MHKEIQSLEQSELFSVASTILCCAVFRSQGVGGNIGSFLHPDSWSPVERKNNEEKSCSKTDILRSYRSNDAEGRLAIMLNNYAVFPKIIRKAEKKIQYKIKSEKEYLRSHARCELGVRVQTSGTSDLTFNEASTNIMIEEAFKTGEVDKGLLKGIKDASVYEEEIRLVSIMRMDFELLEEIIEDLDENDSKIMKQYLVEGRLFKEIADEEGRTYEAIKKRMERIRAEIREEILECLEMNCRGGE